MKNELWSMKEKRAYLPANAMIKKVNGVFVLTGIKGDILATKVR